MALNFNLQDLPSHEATVYINSKGLVRPILQVKMMYFT
jgi:hypothetical protein